MFTEEYLSSVFPNKSKPQHRMIAVPWYIGSFVMTWTKHERMIANMLSIINEVQYLELRDNLLIGQTVDFGKGIASAIKSLTAEHPSIPYLQHVLENHIALKCFRDDIVHGFWEAIGSDQEYYLKRFDRKTRKHSIKTIKLEEIIAEHDRLDHLGVAVINAGNVYQGKEPL